MKKLILFLFLIFVSTPVYAALQADAVFEVRDSGDNTNGSCYDTGGSGTDYSLQDNAQLSLTDLATSGAGVTTLTSATGGFTAEMVDNCIYIASGTNFTVGYYEITVHTDTNTVTLDRTPSPAGAGSNGAGKVGGAADDPEQVSAGVLAGNTVYIKSGTYSVILNTDTAGTAAAPIQWIGYNASRGDYPTGNDRPLLDCANTRANGIVLDVTENYFRNLRIDDCTGDGVSITGPGGVYWFSNIKSNNNTGSGFDDVSATFCMLGSDIEAGANGDSGIGPCASGTTTTHLIGADLHDNTDDGLENSVSARLFWSLFDTNGDDGVGVNSGDTISIAVNNIAYANGGANGVGFNGFGDANISFNNGSYDNGQYGFVGVTNAQNMGAFDYNGYDGNGTADLNGITGGVHDVTTAPQFVNAAGRDFTLLSTSPLIGAGFPQTLGGATGDYQANIGLDQDTPKEFSSVFS